MFESTLDLAVEIVSNHGSLDYKSCIVPSELIKHRKFLSGFILTIKCHRL